MDYNELLSKNQLLEEQIQKLTNELIETKEHLKKYTAPKRSKTFYDNHREEILIKKKNIIQDTVSKERRKEINKKAYQKRKEKLKEETI